MGMKKIILTVAFLTFGLLANAQGGKPNIVFIFADQLRSMELGCYGSRQVKTPNIDRLAHEGIQFTDAISTYPVCSPFRAMLMTGNYPVKNGMLTNDHMLNNPTPYFAEVCKNAGYNTAFIGKWHLNGLGRTAYIPKERQCGFDYWRALECTHNYFNSMYYKDNSSETHYWEDYDALAQARDACKYINMEAGNEPFALFLGWGPPHGPYIAPQEFMDRFSPEKIRLRPNVDDFAQAIEMWKQANTTCPESLKQIPENITPALMDTTNSSIRQWYAGYFAAIEALDQYMGLILQTLEEKGILDNTIIVFTSDHGDNLGSHRQQGKELPYEESLSIPFLVRYPEKIAAGSKTEALLSPIDMMPTILSLANVSCPDVDGKDLSGIAEGRESDVQDAVLIMKLSWLGTNWLTNGNGPWRGVRTKRYTYARKSTSLEPWMLFDNEKDPLQLNNLVDAPAYAKLLEKLDRRTDELLVEAGDPENPFYFLNAITKERNAENLPDRYHDFHPCFQKPGTVFRPYLEKYLLTDSDK